MPSVHGRGIRRFPFNEIDFSLACQLLFSPVYSQKDPAGEEALGIPVPSVYGRGIRRFPL